MRFIHTAPAGGLGHNAVFHDSLCAVSALQVAEINIIVFFGGVSIRAEYRI